MGISHYTTMANAFLCATSCWLTYVHFYFISNAYPFIDPLYTFVILRGCLLSIYNHAYTDPFLESYDRMVMRESIIVDMIYMIKTNTFSLVCPKIIIAVCLYFVSKLSKHNVSNNILHSVAQLLVTIAHVELINEIRFL